MSWLERMKSTESVLWTLLNNSLNCVCLSVCVLQYLPQLGYEKRIHLMNPMGQLCYTDVDTTNYTDNNAVIVIRLR